MSWLLNNPADSNSLTVYGASGPAWLNVGLLTFDLRISTVADRALVSANRRLQNLYSKFRSISGYSSDFADIRNSQPNLNRTVLGPYKFEVRVRFHVPLSATNCL